MQSYSLRVCLHSGSLPRPGRSSGAEPSPEEVAAVGRWVCHRPPPPYVHLGIWAGPTRTQRAAPSASRSSQPPPPSRGAGIHHGAGRPPSRLLRAPPLSSLGLPHLHSPGSRLLGKVTSAHSRARGFHRGGRHRLPPPPRPGSGEGTRARDSGAGAPAEAAEGKARCRGAPRDSDGI